MHTVTPYCLMICALICLHCIPETRARAAHSDAIVGNNMELLHGNGASFLFPLSDGAVSSYIRDFGDFELPFIDLIKAVVPLEENGIFLDIGANFGVWAVPLAKHLEPKGGQVLAFEGTLETYYVLGANVILNGLHNILTFNNIVTNVDMSFKTQIIPYYNDHSLNIGAQSVLKTEIIQEYGLGGHDGERSFQYRDSKGVQLDVLYRSGEIPSCPIFMKLDVELHELQVLQGSLRLLQDCRPFLFVEMNCENMNKSILKLLDSLGYISFWIGLPFVHYTDAVERSGLSLEFIMSSVNILAVPRAKALGVASRFPNVLVTIDLLRPDYHILSSYSIRSCKNAPPGEEAECVIMKQDSNWVCDQISPALTNYWQRL